MHNRASTLLLFLLCACNGTEAPTEYRWMAEVSEKLSAESRAFQEDAGSFRATWADLELEVDADGTWARSGEDELRLRTVAWGRESLSPVPAVDPQEGCGDEVGAAGQCLPRVELVRPGLTEWWQSNARGFEQGWELEERPAGEGKLQLVVAVEGATVAAAAGDLLLFGEEGGTFLYSEAVAWDAEGRELPVVLEAIGDQILLTVDDTDAVWPLTVDPLLSTPTSTLVGLNNTDYFGFSVGGGVDANGDGYDDVIVGAPYYSSSNTGRV